MKKIILITSLLLLNLFLVAGNGDHQEAFEAGKQLVESEIGCDELTNKQLETIGEYFMEQMHPGEAHETMHEMMGVEEGTDYHERFHVNIAQMMYCGEGGMMGMMQMMDGGMMGGQNMQGGGMMRGMMGNYYSSYGVFGWILIILVFVVLVLFIVWLIKELQKPKRRHKRR